MLCSSRAWEDLSPLERFFSALANSGRLREREWVWEEGKFASATCPVCAGRGHLYWKYDDRFVFGCKERCDRDEILGALGLDPFDVMEVTPKWLRKRP